MTLNRRTFLGLLPASFVARFFRLIPTNRPDYSFDYSFETADGINVFNGMQNHTVTPIQWAIPVVTRFDPAIIEHRLYRVNPNDPTLHLIATARPGDREWSYIRSEA